MFKSDEVFKFVIKSLKHPSADMSFLKDNYSDLDKWARETRKWARSKLLYAPPQVPFEPVITEEEDFGKYIRKKLYLNSAEDNKVSAYLLVPKGLRAPVPAIIALHDHSNKFFLGQG